MKDLSTTGIIICSLILMSFLATRCQGAQAAEPTTYAYRIGIMPSSHHFQNKGFNEKHYGVFFEYLLGNTKNNQRNWVGIIYYNNSQGLDSVSLYHQTDYAVTNGFNFGLQVGVVHGYSFAKIIPYVAPTVQLGPGRVVILPVVIAYQALWEFN